MVRGTTIAYRWRGYGLLGGLAVIMATVGLSQPLLVVILGALMVGVLGAASFARRPWRLFALFVFLLPPHVPLMAFLLVHADLPGSAVKAISAWKEGALFLLLLLVAWRSLRSRWVWKLPDLVVFFYAALVGLSALLTLSYGDVNVGSLLYGLRDALLPVLLYMVGRSFPLSELRARQVVRWLLLAALLFSVLGIIERFLIPTEWHVRLGIARYYSELLGLNYPDYLLGLPENYWTSSDSEGHLRRAVSVYGSSQSFALSYLLLLPLCFYGALSRTLPHRPLARVALVVSLIGLLLTVTRFTIVVCLGLLLLSALIYNQQVRKLALTFMMVAGLAVGLVVLVSPGVQRIIVDTVTFQDSSTSMRLIIWQNTAFTILEQPYGYGIGQVGQTANRFGERERAVVNIEGQFSKIAVELGLEGLVLYGGMLVTVSLFLLYYAQQTQQPHLRMLQLSLGLTFVGLALNSITTEWHNSIALVYPTWWLAGACLASRPAKETRQPDTVATPNSPQPLVVPSG